VLLPEVQSPVLLPEVQSPVLLPEVRSRMWPNQPEFKDLIPATGIAHPADIETHVGPDTPVAATIKARSRRFTRFAAAGVLALVLAGGAASVPFITSRSGPLVPAATGTPAPKPGSNDNPRGEDSTGAAHTTPDAASNKPADGPAPPAAAAGPAPHTTRSGNWTTSQSKPPASVTAPAPPRTPAIPAKVYAWFRAAELSARNQRRTHLRPEPPSRP
jgi:hypothetical protein